MSVPSRPLRGTVVFEKNAHLYCGLKRAQPAGPNFKVRGVRPSGLRVVSKKTTSFVNRGLRVTVNIEIGGAGQSPINAQVLLAVPGRGGRRNGGASRGITGVVFFFPQTPVFRP